MTNKASKKNKASLVLKLTFLMLILVFFIKLILFSSSGYLQVQKEDVPEPIPSNICLRSEPYATQPEFERVLSLILQRFQQKNSPLYSSLKGINNCIYIQYADLGSSGAEGMFYFDSEVSSANKLVIEVDSSYAITDDITTAFLLIHELTHAQQFIDELGGARLDCVDSEVDAFYSQLLFGAAINEEESKSVISRLEKGSQNNQLNTYENLIDLSWDALQACKLAIKDTKSQEGINCYKEKLRQKIRSVIVSNPVYQEQCGLN